jgi:hypothetical protein
MRSYPLIQTALSETQVDFIGLVESRAGRNLPGDPVRYSVTTGESEDVTEVRHSVELRSGAGWAVRHALKATESMVVERVVDDYLGFLTERNVA